MFTGLVETTGTLVAVAPRGNGRELAIRCALDDLKIGDSVACNGCCLTVEKVLPDGFVATAGRETLDKTTFGKKGPGDRLHLERALRVGDRLGGHLVQGHVDGAGRLLRAEPSAESLVLWFEAPADLARYIAPKGSICIDGVSLTVNEVDGARFRVNIVPHTVSVTALGALRPGDEVNLEVDVLAKYVERLLQAPAGLSLEKLKEHGFA